MKIVIITACVFVLILSCKSKGEKLFDEAARENKKNNPTRANELFHQSCEAGYGMACSAIGKTEEACEKLYGFACFELGVKAKEAALRVAAGNVIKQDQNSITDNEEYKTKLTQAHDYYVKGCNYDHADSCLSLRDHYRKEGNLSEATRFKKRAESILTAQCKDGDKIEKRFACPDLEKLKSETE